MLEVLTTSLPAPALILSLPVPAANVSAPSPPKIVSLPELPVKLSLPEPPVKAVFTAVAANVTPPEFADAFKVVTAVNMLAGTVKLPAPETVTVFRSELAPMKVVVAEFAPVTAIFAASQAPPIVMSPVLLFNVRSIVSAVPVKAVAFTPKSTAPEFAFADKAVVALAMLV